MEHPEAEVVDDGIAALLDEGAARDEPRQRTLWQVLIVVIGWIVVLAIACVVIVIAAPAIETVIVAIVRAFTHTGTS